MITRRIVGLNIYFSSLADKIEPKIQIDNEYYQIFEGPTLVYIFYISIRFYGVKKWFGKVMDNPSYFIFPLLTCISFYYHSQGSNLSNNSDGQNVNTPSDDIELQQVHNHIQTALQENIGETSANDIDENVAKNEEESLASVSVEDEPNTESLDEEPTEPELRENEAVVVIETQEEPVPIQNVEEKRNDNEDVQFSVLQSNILYFLFALSFIRPPERSEGGLIN